MTCLKTSARILMLVLAAGHFSGCSEQKITAAKAQAPTAPKVTVATPVKRLVAATDEFVGRFVAFDQVDIRARVSGYLDEIHFTDGQLVKKGDPLFTIDDRPFIAARDQAQAALANAEATLTLTDRELERAQSLTRGTTISEGTFDQRIQAKHSAAASVASQQAALRQADLEISFTKLAAPIAGRIGDRRVSVGNLVTGGSTGTTTLLATIVTLDPIRFEFTLDEASFLRYQHAMSQSLGGDAGALPVKLKLIDENAFVHQGKLDFVDNVLDRLSGSIRGRAIFPNADGKFLPGMFGRVQLTASEPAEALLVPDTAIVTEQVRKFVYTVNEENIASPKYVTLGQAFDGLRVITSGLDPEDKVIVNGLMRVRPGSKVAPEQATADAVPNSTATSKSN